MITEVTIKAGSNRAGTGAVRMLVQTMPEMETWEWVLLGGASYLAVMGLVRLMRRRRDAVLDELSVQAELESRRLASEAKQEERRKSQEKGGRAAGERAGTK